MRKLRTPALVAMAIAASVAVIAQLPAPPPRGAQNPAEIEKEERDHEPAPDSLSPALEARIRGRKSLADFRIRVEWPREGTLTSCWIFGDGVGVWNRQIQFRLTKTEVLSVLKAVRRAGFGSLPETFGEEEGGEADLKGRIGVSIGSTTKTILQRSEGSQSPALEGLADFVFQVSQNPSRRGTTASNMADALEKVEAGTLSPFVFEVLAQRKIDHPAASAGEKDWVLRINGRHVTGSTPQPTGPAAQQELTLTETQFLELVEQLRRTDPASLPKNLWAPQYTILRFQVLNQVSLVSARPFTGMTAETHREKQLVFDGLWARMTELYSRVRKEGKRIAVPEPRSPEKLERESD